MSYFFSGKSRDSAVRQDIEKSFAEAVPDEIRKDVFRLEESSSFLVSYGSHKVIPDIMISDVETGSWLALLGTPLISLRTRDEKAALLKRFLVDPIRVVQHELDGCFAVLSRNAITDTFVAATDFNNTIPIFYAAAPTGIFFSSHELPLARFLHSEIDPLGFAQTIHMKLAWGERTRFKNIKKLQACQIMTFQGLEKPASEQYWKPSDEAQWPARFDGALHDWLGILKDSVQAYYDSSSNKTVICDITAGEDSRLLLSQCHSSGIPFLAMVDGRDRDIDVRVSREAAKKTGFELIVRPKRSITEEQLLKCAVDISLRYEGYEDYFSCCTAFATDAAAPPRNYDFVKFCGSPGGEVYRGAYYLRGKAFFPTHGKSFDYRFFTRMKYLLDFRPGLMRFPDEECKNEIYALVEESLKEVAAFPIGIRIDHLLRVFQACNSGLIYKNPRYLPFATKRMTRSIYGIPPHFKRGGKLTKACTEILYPEIAWVKTQKGVPTVRRTALRTFLFLPEYVSTAKSIMSGAVSRLFKWTESNKPSYQWSENELAIRTLLKVPPFSRWFESSKSLLTGHLYNDRAVDSILGEAKAGSSRSIPILGRIINQELAFRWIEQKW